jgi:hypothetical protein
VNVRPINAIVLLALLSELTGCAHHYTPAVVQDPYGFFSGIWHGLLFPFSLIGCMFIDSVFIIGQPNTGWPYYLGFVCGLCAYIDEPIKKIPTL